MRHYIIALSSTLAVIFGSAVAVSCDRGTDDPRPTPNNLATNFTIQGLENAPVTVLTADGQSFEVTLDAGGSATITPGRESTFTKLVSGSHEVLIGRRTGGDIVLNFDNTTGMVVLRPGEDGIVPVGTAAELALLEENRTGKFLQEADLDLTGINWKPICSPTRSDNGVSYTYDYSVYFKGEYDGGNHSIHNLTIDGGNAEGGQYYAGLFGSVGNLQDPGGAIRNLTIASGSVEGLNYCAAIVARICGGTVENCHNYATVHSKTQYAGGLVSQLLSYSTIENCTNRGAVTADSAEAGGIIQSSVAGTVRNCINWGTVTAAASAAGIVAVSNTTLIISCSNYGTVAATNTGAGGIVAVFGGGSNDRIEARMEGCLNEGTVRVAVTDGGGIAGHQQGGKIVNCENSGVVEYTGEAAKQNGGIGGIVGSCATGSEVTGCVNQAGAEIKNVYSTAGGIVGFVTEATISDCVNYDDISVADAVVGGIVGENRGNVNSSVNYGKISGKSRVGGIVGDNYSGVNTARVRFGHNFGEIRGEQFVGGIVGINYAICSASINEGLVVAAVEAAGGVNGGLAGPAGYALASVNKGRVEGANKVGGIAGSMNSKGLTEACYSIGAIKGENSGGICGFLEDADSKALNCYWSNYNGKGISAGISENVCYFDDGTTPAPGVTVGWPEATLANWAEGNGSSGAWWASLGQSGSKNYPQLFWE